MVCTPEMIKTFEESKNKREELRRLAVLNVCTVEEVAAALKEGGCRVDKRYLKPTMMEEAAQNVQAKQEPKQKSKPGPKPKRKTEEPKMVVDKRVTCEELLKQLQIAIGISESPEITIKGMPIERVDLVCSYENGAQKCAILIG